MNTKFPPIALIVLIMICLVFFPAARRLALIWISIAGLCYMLDLPRLERKSEENVGASKSLFKTILHFIYGSPYVPFLSRRAFIRAAVYVFLVRGIIVSILEDLLINFTNSDLASDDLDGGTFIILMSIAGISIIPYFRIMLWRLVDIGSPIPRVFVMLIALLLFLFAGASPEYTEYLDLPWLFAITLPYILLLSWPDPPEEKFSIQ